tara:strand:- start:28231 stop:28416 length:186 start_codon:yes stop_codon:yes gene_type:complete
MLYYNDYVYIPKHKPEIVELIIKRLGGNKSKWNKYPVNSLKKLLWKYDKGYIVKERNSNGC